MREIRHNSDIINCISVRNALGSLTHYQVCNGYEIIEIPLDYKWLNVRIFDKVSETKHFNRSVW